MVCVLRVGTRQQMGSYETVWDETEEMAGTLLSEWRVKIIKIRDSKWFLSEIIETRESEE